MLCQPSKGEKIMNVHNNAEWALNLCDILGRGKNDVNAWVEKIFSKIPANKYTRLYVGSYYCDHYYLNLPISSYIDVIDYARKNKLKVTVVIPQLFEKSLHEGLERTNKLLAIGNDVVDEVTINDWGMSLYYPKEHGVKVNMGRVLQKDNRDPRYKDFFEKEHIHRCFSKDYIEWLVEERISGIELDCTNKEITIPDIENSDIQIAVHTPWTYLSMGSICVYASTTKPDNKKFRFADKCNCECNLGIIKMNCPSDIVLYRYGRSIQFLNENCNVKSNKIIRFIYSPFYELQEN